MNIVLSRPRFFRQFFITLDKILDAVDQVRSFSICITSGSGAVLRAKYLVRETHYCLQVLDVIVEFKPRF